MMAQVLIRDLPDDLVDRFKQRARSRGQSLEAHLREVLEESVRGDREEFLRFAREMRERSGPQTTDSTQLIRDSRDADYER